VKLTQTFAVAPDATDTLDCDSAQVTALAGLSARVHVAVNW
jgi:hypothetical protein